MRTPYLALLLLLLIDPSFGSENVVETEDSLKRETEENEILRESNEDLQEAPKEVHTEREIEKEEAPEDENKEQHHVGGGNKESNKRGIWGAGAVHHHEEHIIPASQHPHENSTSTMTTTATATHLPFVSKPAAIPHAPPEGFMIDARVYIEPTDSLAYFDDNPLILPYYDCGVTGSTTSPFALKHAYFRHALAATTSTSWSGTESNHPVLAVALSPLIMELNSGQSHTFQPGDVILLEDVLLPGHKMKPLNQDLMVLFLTLPQQHYHTGKDHLSIKTVSKKQEPCRQVTNDPDDVTTGSIIEDVTTAAGSSWNARKIRIVCLTALGMSLSTLAADFLGKVAPLWLAVGVGGTAFVVTGTWGFVKIIDSLWDALELWQERRKLGTNNNSNHSLEEASIESPLKNEEL